VTKTLLAVDDSATMRKVLEITFTGEDFKVLTAEGKQTALDRLTDKPDVCVIDTQLASGEDGYAVAGEIRKRDPKAVIVLLASRHTPYDQSRGKECGADDFVDKPFDTQQIIDKVKKAILTRGTGAGDTAGAPMAAAASSASQPSAQQQQQQRKRAATLVFGNEPVTGTDQRPDAAAAAPAAAAAAKPAASAATAPTGGTHVTQAVNGNMSVKLDGLGLTKEQTEAVLAISREVLERVVWEVVPQLAEALIKEELARLTK
jgi:DNA-binding response OmpR family regulator